MGVRYCLRIDQTWRRHAHIRQIAQKRYVGRSSRTSRHQGQDDENKESDRSLQRFTSFGKFETEYGRAQDCAREYEGYFEVAKGIVTVWYHFDSKSTQAGPRPDVIARLLLRELVQKSLKEDLLNKV